MATIVAVFKNIAGESQISGYEDAVEAFGIADEAMIAEATGRLRKSGSRTVGKGIYQEVILSRKKDSASPKLATAASSGLNVGNVDVVLFRSLEVGVVPYMTIKLAATIIEGYDIIQAEGGGLVENVSLSSPRVTWTYTQYKQGVESGNVSAGWDQQKGIELA